MQTIYSLHFFTVYNLNGAPPTFVEKLNCKPTQLTIHKIYEYLELVNPYWLRKNDFLSLDILPLSNSICVRGKH